MYSLKTKDNKSVRSVFIFVIVALFFGFMASSGVAHAQRVTPQEEAQINVDTRDPRAPLGPFETRTPREPFGYGGGPRFPDAPRVPDTEGILDAVRERIAGIFSRLFGGGFGPEQARR
jgi:hypothetical protein